MFSLRSLDAVINFTFIFIEVNSRGDVPGVMPNGYAAQSFSSRVPIITTSGPADGRHEFVKSFRANGFLPLATFLGFSVAFSWFLV